GPVRGRIVVLPRSMSAATRPTSWSIEALGLSKGTITATSASPGSGASLYAATIGIAAGCGKSSGPNVADSDTDMICFGSGNKFLKGVVLRELIRANDAVLVSAVGALLDGAGIRYLVLDQNMSV